MVRKCIECNYLDLDWDQYPCNICNRETLSEWKGDRSAEVTARLRSELADVAMELFESNQMLKTVNPDDWGKNRHRHRMLRDKMYEICKQIKGGEVR